MHFLNVADRLAKQITKTFEEAATQTTQQARVLAAIGSANMSDQTTLVAASGIDRSTMSDVLRRLERQGLIARTRKKTDARAYELRLTRLGRTTLRNCEKAYHKVEHQLASYVEEALKPTA